MRNMRTGDHVLRNWRWRIKGESVRFAEQHWKFSKGSIYEGIGFWDGEEEEEEEQGGLQLEEKFNRFICDSSICVVWLSQQSPVLGESQGQNITVIYHQDCFPFKYDSYFSVSHAGCNF